jgi:hypothetical protein
MPLLQGSGPYSDFGWIQDPDEVQRIVATLPMPYAQGMTPALDEKKEFFCWDIARKVLNGQDVPKGPQKIGDCVSWGWHNLVNYVSLLQIYKELRLKGVLDLESQRSGWTSAQFAEQQLIRDTILEEYQEACTEAIYGLSRVEVGGQRGSNQDGSVGAWAAKAVSEYGIITRKYLDKKGLGGAYDPTRAKKWGAQGLPDDLEPEAKQHIVKTTSMVKTFAEAAALIQNGYPVAVCSNQGFSMQRGADGFCNPEGQWAHCMLFCGVRWDKPGLCCSQSWGPNTPSGPVAKGQPDNTFWVAESTVNRMLSSEDSFTGSEFQGYPAQDFLTWHH